MVALKIPDPRTVTPFFRDALAYMARTVDAVALENFVDYLAGNSQGSGGSLMPPLFAVSACLRHFL
ncbi:hypothetical protein [Ensifer aridi]|uniref:hypothetical protein n=1 Tax=Ensifer aridi TaxID=1708715 RepID=UPI0011116BB6|nr:hypothetical protein [Ensifer aridi]